MSTVGQHLRSFPNKRVYFCNLWNLEEYLLNSKLQRQVYLSKKQQDTKVQRIYSKTRRKIGYLVAFLSRAELYATDMVVKPSETEGDAIVQH